MRAPIKILKIFSFSLILLWLSAPVSASPEACEDGQQLKILREADGPLEVGVVGRQFFGWTDEVLIENMTEPGGLEFFHGSAKRRVCLKISDSAERFQNTSWSYADEESLSSSLAALSHLLDQASKDQKTFEMLRQHAFDAKKNKVFAEGFYSELEGKLRERRGFIPVDPAQFLSFYFDQYCSSSDLTKQREIMKVWSEIAQEQSTLLRQECQYEGSFSNRVQKSKDAVQETSSKLWNGIRNWFNSDEDEDTVILP